MSPLTVIMRDLGCPGHGLNAHVMLRWLIPLAERQQQHFPRIPSLLPLLLEAERLSSAASQPSRMEELA